MTRDRALLMLALTTLACGLALVLVPEQIVWARTLLGIPFAMLLPGAAAMLLVDPDGRVGLTEWFALAVSVSVSVTVLTGMGLALAGHLNTPAIVVVLGVLTLAVLTVASFRPEPSTAGRVLLRRRNPVWRAALSLGGLLLCTGLALALSFPDPFTAHSGHVIQLWGLPDAAEGGLRIGTNNVNSASSHFRLTISQAGRQISATDVDLPTGTSHVYVVKRSALWTAKEPVVATLAETTGAESTRTISVWTTP
jgi:hypothetical protein